VALPVPVDHISGLDDFDRPESAGGSSPHSGYQGDDFRNAYAPRIASIGCLFATAIQSKRQISSKVRTGA